MMQWCEALRDDEAAVLRAARREHGMAWRCCDLAREAELKYAHAWQALIRLQKRGYATQDMLRRWSFRWESVAWPHRAQVSRLLDAEPEEFVLPGWWQGLVERWGGHFGVTWVGRA